MSGKSPAQLDREIAEALGTPTYAEKNRKAERAAQATGSSPKLTGTTTIIVPNGQGDARPGYGYTYKLTPADLRTKYSSGGGQDLIATRAKKSMVHWLVQTKNGTYVGVLEEGIGREPWAIYKFDPPRGAISSAGEPVRGNSQVSSASWRDAVKRGFSW
jgi:hypothetical protein